MKKIRSIISTFLLSLGILSVSSCYQLFQSRVPLNPEGTDKTLSDIIVDEKEITQLSAPAQIFVSSGTYSDRIKISWTPVKGASSYRLERAIKTPDDTEELSESDFEAIPSSSTNLTSSLYVFENSYTDIILESPSYSSPEYSYTYYYRISAENSFMKYEPSEFLQSEAAVLFSPSKSITATAGESLTEIELSWAKTENASKYNLYRSKESDGVNSILIASLTGNITSYTNTIPESDQGVDFYYYIVAENSFGNKSTLSPLALGYTLVKGAPARVTGVQAETRGNKTNGIDVSWNAVSFGDGTNKSYSIYRSSSTDSSLTLLKTIDAPDSSAPVNFTDTKAIQPNTYYYYRVLALITENTGEGRILKGPLSQSSATDFDPSSKKSMAAEGFILSAPGNIAVNKVENTNTISFSKAIGEQGYPNDSGLYQDYKNFTYKIFAGNDSNDVSTELSVSLSEKDANTYIATVPVYEFYRVQTVNGNTLSNLSPVCAPSPKAAGNASASQHAYISGYTDNASMANANKVYPVKITWSEPEGGASGYYVFRSTKQNSGFRRITDNPVTETEYIDKNDSAKAGTYYYYRVLALNSLNQGSNYSDTVIGYGAITHDQYMREYNKTIQRSQKKLTLMHNSDDMKKLGVETVNGDLSGTLTYNAGGSSGNFMTVLSDGVIMTYTNYADYYVSGTQNYMFLLSGNTNTKADASSNGNMFGTMTADSQSMYPGKIIYDNVKIVKGSAGGGYYLITPAGFPEQQVSYTVGNEGW